jgi:hypothetical protein
MKHPSGVVLLAMGVLAGSAIAGDIDGDGIEDLADNCTLVANASQLDADDDGYGNACDADLNNSGLVTTADYAILRSVLNQSDAASPTAAAADLNGSGLVTTADFAIQRARLNTPPGPSGLLSANPFPVRVEPGKRYLVDASGQPFFVNGDTAWALMVQLDLAGAEEYLEDRRSRGINAVAVELIENAFGDNAPNNYAGAGPFLVGRDFSTPNEAYFAHVAAIVGLAASKGILVLLAPAYMGYNGYDHGWYPDMVANGATKLRNYGRYLGARFAGHDNIIWVHGGDWNPPAEGVALGGEIAEGIRDIDVTRRWLHTFHASGNTSALDSAAGNEPWLTTDIIYASDNTVVEEAYSTWSSAELPYFLYEAAYENASNSLTIRKQAYQATLSGASGHVIGNATVWRFKAGWQSALDSPASRAMPRIKALFTSRQWWLLVPDIGFTFLTGGNNPGPHQSPAALASDGSFGLVYTPEFRQLTVNLSRLAGPQVAVRWFDPLSGSYTPIAGSPFSATGNQAFVPPAINSEGSTDWVLVLESAP